ncbi:MAG: DegT/DnrJ/EryC1/StrS family aminotransferase [Myxococcota bacterium]
MSELALLGGTPVRDKPIAARWPDFGDTEREGLLEVLESRAWGGYPEPSPKAAEFAKRFAGYHDAEHGICATNGSVTLEVALAALDLEAGDEVIVPTYTWIATGVAPIHLNGVPVFVDVDPETYCIDCDQVEAAITDRTRGVVAVHLGANAADLDRLTEICDKHDLFLIEDCAHAHGGKWRGQGLGSWGDFGSFSFQVSKLMTSGEGGGLITKNAELAARAHWVVDCGRREGFEDFPGHLLGVNARMTEFQAAVLLGQLERLEEATQRRERAIEYLEQGLKEIGGLKPLARDARQTTRHAYQLLFKYDPDEFAGVHRDKVGYALAAEGVELDGPFYVPMHEHPLMHAESRHWPYLRERYGDGIKARETQQKLDFPVATKAAYHEAVWMHYPYLMGSREDLDAILEAVAKVKKHAEDLRA